MRAAGRLKVGEAIVVQLGSRLSSTSTCRYRYAKSLAMAMILDSVDHYAIGWIAALPIERAAAIALLDERHDTPKGFEQHPSDTNSYTWGRMGKHNIVVASLPAGVYGTRSAAVTAARLLSSLPQVRIGLLVGIGAGIARPDQDRDIRLGDVVVGQPEGKTGGVIQYDLGKAKMGRKWERKGILNMPPLVLLHALASLQAEHEIGPSRIPDILHEMCMANPHMAKSNNKMPGFVHQGFGNDRLFKSAHGHVRGNTCDNCDPAWEIERDPRDTTDPEIHYGIIASGDTLIKDAAARDKMLEETGEECICLDGVAAGLINCLPCLVIKGICDYADSHSNDRWQRYAAATAAAYAKELLGWVPSRQLQDTPRAVGALPSGQSPLEAHILVSRKKNGYFFWKTKIE
ncbi:ankyrin repeat protein [Trichoderma ceciliae]